MNKRTFLAGLVGFIVSFLLGWLTYGLLLKDIYNSGTMAGVNKPEEEMIIWAMILGAIVWIVLLVYLLEKTGARTFGSGAITGLWIGICLAISLDLYFWGGTNLYTGTTLMFVDIVNNAVTSAITCGVIGMMLGKGMKAPAHVTTS